MKLETLFQKGIEAIRAGQDLELLHIEESHGSTPRGTDAWMLVDAEGKSNGTIGGGAVEYQGMLDAQALLLQKQNGRKAYSLSREAAAGLGMVCGGNVEVSFRYLEGGSAEAEQLFESLLDTVRRESGRVYLFGGGHVSEECCALLAHLGFYVVVYDDRAEFVQPERFPAAERLICASYEDVKREVQPGESDYILIMTRGHQYDYLVQKQLLRAGAAYMGVIGSRRKLEEVERKLLSDGFSAEEIHACYAPIGIQIAAESPEEIAVSIAAELILVRARREKRRKVLEGKTIQWYPD